MTRAFVVFSEKTGLKCPMGILQNQTNGLLQLILYKRHGKVVGDTLFFERLTQGVTEEAHALGYDLSVRYFYGSQPTDEQIRAIQSEPFEALLRFGYRIPQDVSVIGFDDSSISTTFTPPLTTPRSPGGRPFAHSPAKKCARDPNADTKGVRGTETVMSSLYGCFPCRTLCCMSSCTVQSGK